MSCYKIRTPTSPLPLTVKGTDDDPETKTCCAPGCFTCANGDKHPPPPAPPTALTKFLSILQTHKEILTRGFDEVESRIKEIRAVRLDADLESGHQELRELADVRWGYLDALDDVEGDVAYAKRVNVYSQSECANEEEEDKGEEEIDEMTELGQQEKCEEEVEDEFFEVETEEKPKNE
jgi:hypothetical protein